MATVVLDDPTQPDNICFRTASISFGRTCGLNCGIKSDTILLLPDNQPEGTLKHKFAKYPLVHHQLVLIDREWQSENFYLI
jgi:hypothetical protein